MKRYRFPDRTATASPEQDVSPFSRIVTSRYAGNIVFEPPINREEQLLRACVAFHKKMLTALKKKDTTESKD